VWKRKFASKREEVRKCRRKLYKEDQEQYSSPTIVRMI
jgi:hypothetical protein